MDEIKKIAEILDKTDAQLDIILDAIRLEWLHIDNAIANSRA